MNRIEADIAGARIPLKVTEDEEVYVRKAIDEINKRIKQYQTDFAQKDIQDCIRMALLTYAVDYYKTLDRVVDEPAWNTLIDIRNTLQVLEAKTTD